MLKEHAQKVRDHLCGKVAFTVTQLGIPVDQFGLAKYDPYLTRIRPSCHPMHLLSQIQI